MQFRRLVIRTDREQPWQLDGDVMGATTRLIVTTLPARLVLRVPPDRRVPAA
jgi:diacylglycerol kinase family enzyme